MESLPAPAESTEFVIYAEPGELNFKFIAGPALPGLPDKKGFLIHPFAGTPWYFAGGVGDLDDEARAWVEANLHMDACPVTLLGTQASRDAYEDAVAGAVAQITANLYEKLVISHCGFVDRVMDVSSLLALMELLRRSYPQAFISLCCTRAHGIWLGASPEVLCRRLEDGSFETMSLAGTRLASDEHRQAPFAEKELEEQAIVTRYMLEALAPIAEVRQVLGPERVQAGPLVHLQTLVRFDAREAGLLDVAAALHPTPAIGGYPKEAIGYLPAFEGHERDLYAGYLGFVSETGPASLYVNLRCGRAFADGLMLYAGAGINKKSVPAAEWAETEQKMEVLGRLVRRL